MSRNGHPSTEELIELVKPMTGMSISHWHSHLADCRDCQARLQRLRPVIKQLESYAGAIEVVLPGDHLSDDLLAAYVYGRVSPEERAVVDAHLQGCGYCTKEVLRVRAHRAALVQGGEAAGDSDRSQSVSLPAPWYRSAWRAALAAGLAIFAVVPWLIMSDWGDGVTVQMAQSEVASRVLEADRIHLATPGVEPLPSAEPATLKVGKAPEQGGIDWYNGFIETTATGTVDMNQMKNPVQAEIVAEKTARHLAYAQLAEVLEGIHVTEDTTYHDLLLRASHLKVATEGFIRGATIVRKTVEWINDVPRASVTLRVPLRGAGGLSSVLRDHWPSRGGARPAGVPDTVNEPHPPRPLVVVDARGLDYQPALQLHLKAEADQILAAGWLGGEMDTPEVVYRRSMEEVLSASPGVAPVIVRAISSGAPGRLVVDEAGARTVSRMLPGLPGRAPEQMTVVF